MLTEDIAAPDRLSLPSEILTSCAQQPAPHVAACRAGAGVVIAAREGHLKQLAACAANGGPAGLDCIRGFDGLDATGAPLTSPRDIAPVLRACAEFADAPERRDCAAWVAQALVAVGARLRAADCRSLGRDVDAGCAEGVARRTDWFAVV